MTPIRPLELEDLPAIAALYARFVDWDVDATVPGLVEFFRRALVDQPFADPEIPSLVYDDRRDGVVGFVGSLPRRFVHGDNPIRVASVGPLIVHPDHRARGVGALLLRQYASGPQDLTSEDRAIDQVHAMWQRLGGVTNTATSVGWGHVVAPTAFVASAVARRAGRRTMPGAALLARASALGGRRSRAAPSAGTSEPLADGELVDLVGRLDRQFPVRPLYDEVHLTWLFGVMETVNVGDRLVRRLVRADDGRPVGAYVMYVTVHWVADVMQVVAADEDMSLVLDHLMHDAAAEGAVEVRGRIEPQTLPYLRTRRCRLVEDEWTVIHARDPALVDAVLSGRALLTRLDGEWWMRPRQNAS